MLLVTILRFFLHWLTSDWPSYFHVPVLFILSFSFANLFVVLRQFALLVCSSPGHVAQDIELVSILPVQKMAETALFAMRRRSFDKRQSWTTRHWYVLGLQRLIFSQCFARRVLSRKACAATSRHTTSSKNTSRGRCRAKKANIDALGKEGQH